MLLNFALIAVFSFTSLAVAGVLLDSALRARNAYGALHRAAHASYQVPVLVRQVEAIEIGRLPAFRAGGLSRPTTQRCPGVIDRTRASAAA